MRRCMFDAVPDSAKLPRHLASGRDAEETDIKPYALRFVGRHLSETDTNLQLRRTHDQLSCRLPICYKLLNRIHDEGENEKGRMANASP